MEAVSGLQKNLGKKGERGNGCAEGEGEGGSSRRGVLAPEMATARACLPEGMGGSALRRQSAGVERGKVSRKQSRVCL